MGASQLERLRELGLNKVQPVSAPLGRTSESGMRQGPEPPLAPRVEMPGWARTIPWKSLKLGPLVLLLPLWGRGLWVSAKFSACLWEGIQGSLIPHLLHWGPLPFSLPFPLLGSCLVTARAFVGKHDWLC